MTSRAFLQAAWAVAAVGLLLAPSALAGQGGETPLYEFETLEFNVHPEGVPPSENDDPEGSALGIHIRNVSVVDFEASDLRYCIDGWGSPYCPAEHPAGNKDEQVTTDEIEAFQDFVRGVLAFAFPEVQELVNLLKDNVTIDGASAERVRFTSVKFIGAEGAVDSMDRVEVEVNVLARYGNDAGSMTHTIRVDGLDLLTEGFAYEQTFWHATSDSGSNWVFQADQAMPVDAQSKIDATGMVAGQDAFEGYTQDGLVLVLEREGREGGGSSPGASIAFVVVAAALAVAVLRRRSD